MNVNMNINDEKNDDDREFPDNIYYSPTNTSPLKYSVRLLDLFCKNVINNNLKSNSNSNTSNRKKNNPSPLLTSHVRKTDPPLTSKPKLLFVGSKLEIESYQTPLKTDLNFYKKLDNSSTENANAFRYGNTYSKKNESNDNVTKNFLLTDLSGSGGFNTNIKMKQTNDSKDSKGSYRNKEGVKLNKKSNKSSHFKEDDIDKLFIKYNIFK